MPIAQEDLGALQLEGFLQGIHHIGQQLLGVEKGADLAADFIDRAQLAVAALLQAGELIHAFGQGDDALADLARGL